LTLLLAAMGSAGLVRAQVASPTTLQGAVERAILQNPEVKLRFHNLEAVNQERRAAEGAWLPRVDLEAAAGAYQYLSPSTPSTMGYDGNRASLQLRQLVFDGFATSNEIRRLSYSQQSAFYDLISASNQIGLEAVRAYLDVQRFRDLLTLAADNFTTHLEVHDKIAEKVKAGVGRRVDLEQAAGRLALAESNWLTEVSNLHDVSARYQRLIGDTPSESLARIDPVDDFLPLGTEFLNEAVLKNPDFLGAVSQIRAYRADEKVKRAALSPTLELRARQSFETNQTGTLGNFRDTALELVLNYNLYRGGSDNARAKQSAAKLDSAFDLRDKACRDIWQTGQIAFNDSIRLGSQLKLLTQHELSTSKARQAYQQQFDIGQRTLLDLLDTENELYQARRALANAEFDLQLAELRVLAVSGTLLGALKLQPLATVLPTADALSDKDDELMRCSTRIVPTQTLNRGFANASGEAPQPPVVAAPVATPAPAPAQPKPEVVQCARVPALVEGWLAAWNGKQTSAYLGLYAENFTPALGLSRKAWESLRKKRITKQGEIVTRARDVTTQKCDGKTAEVSFAQEYGSTDYKDAVEKTLSLEWVTGAWKITRETVTKGRTF
jgi:adhesin transport system outer membrane protein